ncbi:MAG: hypothetical protein L0H70_02980 [Xanthomonadales bacterium]|nr:hypothetical protein [Xanthomonadales bacterium]
MQHQFNLGSAVQPPPFIPRNDPDAPMFASVDGVAAVLSDEEIVFQVRGTDQSQVMTHQVLQCMAGCREFRSMDEHIARIMRHVPGLKDPARVRQGLEALVRSGLMQSDQQFLDELRAAPVTPQPLAAICIRACDRPQQVQRLLASLAVHEASFGGGHSVVLIDDSRKSAHAKANEQHLSDYASETKVETHYIGSREREKLLKKAQRDLPHLADAASDLIGARDGAAKGYGSSWNTALLLTAGRRLLLLDEDFELPLRRHADYQPGLDVRPGLRDSVQFFSDLDSALAAGDALDSDPLQLHLAALGQPLGAMQAQPELALSREDLRGLELTQLRQLLADARVVSVSNGARGAYRGDSAQWMYLLDAASRNEFCRDRDAYLHNIEGQSLWFGYARAHPTQQSVFTPFALDNSELLPCTAPVGANEDALFGILVRLCQPHGINLHLPLSIGHVQETARRRSDKTTQALTPNFNAFVYETLQNHLDSVHASEPAQRLRMVANVLDDIAASSAPARIALLREYLNYTRADLVARLQQQLAEATDAPVFWRTDVLEIITANGRALITQTPPRLADWPLDADAATCARLLAEQLHILAAGLRAWPTLWTWASERGDALITSL